MFVRFRQVFVHVRLQTGIFRQELRKIFALHANGQLPTAGSAAWLNFPLEQVSHRNAQPVQQLPALALSDVFDLLGNVGRVGLTGPAGAEQSRVASILDVYRVFNCSGSTA